MKFSDMPAWVPVVGAILAAGMYIGALAQRVTTLENLQRYEHGTFQLPAGAK